VPQPGRGKIERRLPVWERTNDARAPPDLAQNALERIVGADAPPVFLREAIVGKRLLYRRLALSASPMQASEMISRTPMGTAALEVLEERAPACLVRGVCAEDLRLRFFARIAELSAAEADKLSHLDYGHEMAFIAIAAVHICFGRIWHRCEPSGCRGW
jgi:hypothetical protein